MGCVHFPILPKLLSILANLGLTVTRLSVVVFLYWRNEFTVFTEFLENERKLSIHFDAKKFGSNQKTRMKKSVQVYQQIYDIVRLIPEGKVATYGQIAKLVNRCTPRMVGYAMAALPFGSDVPWQRVINSQGKISRRVGGDDEKIQRSLLESEGVEFDSQGRVDFYEAGWQR
jgi:methylated-DNA-protein-cysteine methyltransferase-like protein